LSGTVEGKGSAVRTKPVGNALRPARFGVDGVGVAQGGDEDLRPPHFARVTLDDVHGHPGVVDKQLVTR
jgi:hypothetical protein